MTTNTLYKTVPAPTTRELQCNGLTFPVLMWGPEGGRPILLLHGFPQEPVTWAPIAEALASDGFQVFAPCQRGYAESTRPNRPGGYTFTQFAADTVGIADALRLKTFDVAGFGMGGAQAWMVTTSQPDRIRSLTAIRFPHPAAFAHGLQFEPGQKEKWRRLEQDLGAGGPEQRAAMMLADDATGLRRFLAAIALPQPFLDRYVARLKDPDALIGALSWEHAVSPGEFSKVPRVTAPTLLIWSEGPALSRTTVAATKDYVDAPYQELLIPNAGNFLLESCSSTLIPPLRKHLQST